MELQLRGITVTYGGIKALEGLDLDLGSGDATALLGDRASGKTTLFALLAGKVAPHQGSMTLDGAPYTPHSPRDARRAGVGIVEETPLLAMHLTAEENILLGLEPAHRGWIDRDAQRHLAEQALLPLHGHDILLETPVYRLSLGQQRRVELARLLLGKPRAILLDTLGRPRHAVPPVEQQNLAELALRLAASGVALLYACRSPEEARQAKTTIVLREGRLVDSIPAAEFCCRRAWKAMSSPFPTDYHRPVASPVNRARPLLQLFHAGGARLPRRVSLTTFPGEIYGLAGMPDAGAPELLRLIFGEEPLLEGEVRLCGKIVHQHRLSGRLRSRPAIGHLSTRPRPGEALLPSGTLAENLLLNRTGLLQEIGSFTPEQERTTRDWLEKLRIFNSSPWMLARDLSRGNQRMLALGRLFQEKPRVLLLDDPTRGVSGLIKSRICRWLRSLASDGASILIYSPSVAELLGVCDTIGVMRRGVLLESRVAEAWTEEELLAMATGEEPRPLKESLSQ